MSLVGKIKSLSRAAGRGPRRDTAAARPRWAKLANPALLLFNFVNLPLGDQRYLRELDNEKERLERLWKGRDPWRVGQPSFRCNVTPDKVVEFLTRDQARNDVCIFHFAGHANSDLLELTPTGDPTNPLASAHAGGLATLLGKLPRLRLVFLNGCSTLAQAKELNRQGVPAIVVTTGVIADNAAALFSGEFYANLLSNDDLRTAFDKAAAAVKTFLSDDQIVRRQRPTAAVPEGLSSGPTGNESSLDIATEATLAEDFLENPWHLEAEPASAAWKLADATGETRKQRQRTRVKWGILALLVLVSVCAPYFVYRAYVERRFSFARELAETSRTLPTDGRNTHVALALAAVSIDQGRGRLESLLEAILRAYAPTRPQDRIFIKTDTEGGLLRDVAWEPPRDIWGSHVAVADEKPGVAIISHSDILVAPSAYLSSRIAKNIGACLAVAWHPTKPNVLAAATQDGSVWIVNTHEVSVPPKQIVSAMKSIASANQVTPQNLVTAYVMTDPYRQKLETDVNATFTALAWKPDGSELLCAGRFRTSILWKEDGALEIPGGMLHTWGVTWNNDGSQFLLSGQGNDKNFDAGEIQIWNRNPLKLAYNNLRRRDVVLNVAANPSKPALFACVTESASAEIWHAGGTEPDKRLRDAWRNFGAMGDHLRGVSWHSSGNLLATAGLEGIIRLWAPESGRCLAALDPPREAGALGPLGYTKLAWSPNGAWLAAATTKGQVWFWNVDLRRWHIVGADLDPQPPDAATWTSIFRKDIPYRKLTWHDPNKRSFSW